MKGKAFFIDTTLCTACKGCQVACKQWHQLPAEKTENRGSFQNPGDLSFQTYKLVRMSEVLVDGKLKWLFFPDQCRHCLEPPCRDMAGDEKAVFKDDRTGAVIYTAQTKGLLPEELECPYNIPRKGENGLLAKCDMCIDRVYNGQSPACVKTCPAGAMNFGDYDKILDMAHKRLKEVKKFQPTASLLDPEMVRVIYLVTEKPLLYHQFSIAGVYRPGITRTAALRKLAAPFVRAAGGV